MCVEVTTCYDSIRQWWKIDRIGNIFDQSDGFKNFISIFIHATSSPQYQGWKKFSCVLKAAIDIGVADNHRHLGV